MFNADRVDMGCNIEVFDFLIGKMKLEGGICLNEIILNKTLKFFLKSSVFMIYILVVLVLLVDMLNRIIFYITELIYKEKVICILLKLKLFFFVLVVVRLLKRLNLVKVKIIFIKIFFGRMFKI